MPIYPLPILEEEQNLPRPEFDVVPRSVVVSYGYMKLMADLPYEGDVRPLPNQKLVIRSSRGTELAEMRATTCATCDKNKIDRKQVQKYIESSGGKHYPFTTQGKALRIATAEDLVEQSRLDDRRAAMRRFAKQQIEELKLNMHLVEAEPLLGGERIIFHYTSENWVDFRELVRVLASEYQTRIEMHQVSARDEARITADFERCGQQCCCQTFLKYLRPVSMRSAKVQKATLDPSKISGRCGRLMCCLRYEDATYEELRKKLPHRQTRVMTEAGPATVIDSQIITQLVMVRMDEDDTQMAFGVEEITIMTREQATEFNAKRDARLAEEAERRDAGAARRAARQAKLDKLSRRKPSSDSPSEPDQPLPDTDLSGPDDEPIQSDGGSPEPIGDYAEGAEDAGPQLDEPGGDAGGPSSPRKRRRRRGGKSRGRSDSGDSEASTQGPASPSDSMPRSAAGDQTGQPPARSSDDTDPGQDRPEGAGGGGGKRRRRRRRKPRGGEGG